MSHQAAPSITPSAMIFCLLLLGICHCAAAEEPPLNVGMELSYPPFEMMTPQGEASGVSVDIAEALGKDLNRQIIIDNIPFIGLIPALQTKKIDLIISSMSVTDERKQAVAFSQPYLTTGLCLLISAKSDLQTIDQANQLKRVIVVKSGSSGELYAQKNLKLAQLIILERESSSVLEVIQGKADAFIYDQFSVFTNWQKNLSTTRAALDPFKKETWAIALRQEDKALQAQVNAFLTRFRKEGGFERLGDKYLQTQKQAFKKLGIPFIF